MFWWTLVFLYTILVPKDSKVRLKRNLSREEGGLQLFFSVQGGSRGAERWMETIDCKIATCNQNIDLFRKSVREDGISSRMPSEILSKFRTFFFQKFKHNVRNVNIYIYYCFIVINYYIILYIIIYYIHILFFDWITNWIN